MKGLKEKKNTKKGQKEMQTKRKNMFVHNFLFFSLSLLVNIFVRFFS